MIRPTHAQPEWEAAATVSRFRPSGVIGTPFHPRAAFHSQASWFFNWDLHHVVAVFEDFHEELRAIRDTVAMGDYSPLTKCSISGPDAPEFVDRLFPRDTKRLKVGAIFYTALCNEDGKVITDGLLFREGERSFRFTGDPMVDWFRQHAEPYDVEVRDVTDDYGILAIQGPRSRAVLELATGRDWSDLDFSRLHPATVAGVAVEVARQGFTGELGYEFLTPAEGAPQVWDAVVEAGVEHGIRPCGHQAIDVARVEAGLLIPGADYANAGPDPTGSHTPSANDPANFSSPFELGMGWLIDLDKEDFVGRAALAAEVDGGGARHKLVGLDIDWRRVVSEHLELGVPPEMSRVAWEAKPITIDGRNVGRASSITWGPTVRRLIGFGHIPPSHSEVGTKVAIEWAIPGTGETIFAPATVCELPFLKLRRK